MGRPSHPSVAAWRQRGVRLSPSVAASRPSRRRPAPRPDSESAAGPAACQNTCRESPRHRRRICPSDRRAACAPNSKERARWPGGPPLPVRSRRSRRVTPPADGKGAPVGRGRLGRRQACSPAFCAAHQALITHALHILGMKHRVPCTWRTRRQACSPARPLRHYRHGRRPRRRRPYRDHAVSCIIFRRYYYQHRWRRRVSVSTYADSDVGARRRPYTRRNQGGAGGGGGAIRKPGRGCAGTHAASPVHTPKRPPGSPGPGRAARTPTRFPWTPARRRAGGIPRGGLRR